MGLGTTIQSIALTATVLSEQNREYHLVVARENVVPHWPTEFEVPYSGRFKVITHNGPSAERFERFQEALDKNPDFDVLVTNFDLCLCGF